MHYVADNRRIGWCPALQILRVQPLRLPRHIATWARNLPVKPTRQPGNSIGFICKSFQLYNQLNRSKFGMKN